MTSSTNPQPTRTGLMDLLRNSVGSQFVIPVFQRNYTWAADKHVKQYLSDLEAVLTGNYKNHFLGIMIYVEKSLSFNSRELIIIDGQQRLTTTFLLIYAIKKICSEDSSDSIAESLQNQFLTDPFAVPKPKYKLKPLVSDDNAYRCIIEDRLDDIEDPSSNVLKNYNYIYDYLVDLLSRDFTPGAVLEALNKLYVVCVPITEDDNAQKIFESINATGVKLTSADLIRNFLLMNLDSDTQDTYYEKYWKKIENNVSSDSKVLEMFFRTYLSIKKYELIKSDAVYRSFVDWVQSSGVTIKDLFEELTLYAGIYNKIRTADLNTLNKDIRDAICEYRKIDSELPLPLVFYFYLLFQDNKITAETLSGLVNSINCYLVRRSICELNTRNISKLFPTLLRKIVETCGSDYANIVAVLNQEMVGNNIGTSGSYMPTDQQMYDFLIHANVYQRPALRVIFDRIETVENPAPVDLTKLSVEHLMPQTPTEQWLTELDIDEATYNANLHRLGNLTLAAKRDNSKMSNLLWGYKNEVLRDTAHLKMNLELLDVEQWGLQNIEDRTCSLINKICKLYPYPDVTASYDAEPVIDTGLAKQKAMNLLPKDLILLDPPKTKSSGHSDSLYKTSDGKSGYVLAASKFYPLAKCVYYWFAYRQNVILQKFSDCDSVTYAFICRGKTPVLLNIPCSFLDEHKDSFITSLASDGVSVDHYHITIYQYPDNRYEMLLSRPQNRRIDITQFFAGELT